MIRAILFDLDGTLVDAAPLHEDAFNEALEFWGREPLTHEEHLKEFNGLSTKRKLEKLVEQGRLKKTESPFIHQTKQQLTISLIAHHIIPNFQIMGAVEYAREVAAKSIGVVTNCSRQTAKMMLRRSALIDFFDVIITNEDVDGLIKPHHWPYMLGQKALGVSYRETLAVEDTELGIKSARESGCKTWLTNYRELSKATLQSKLNQLKYSI